MTTFKGVGFLKENLHGNQNPGKHNLAGWRKIHNWHNDLKNKIRALGRASDSDGKGKQQRVEQVTRAYLAKANVLPQKLEKSKSSFP